MQLRISPIMRGLRSKPRTFFLCICFSLLMQPYTGSSQETPKRDRQRSSPPTLESQSTSKSSEQNKGYTIGVKVDLVVMYTSVFDSKGRFVGGINKDRFKLYEDGIEQKIVSFSPEDVPVSMGILMDSSGSMKGEIEQVNSAALAFIRAGNPQDETFLISFNDEVELLQDFTSDIDEITDALDNLVVSGGTSLYDAIYLGIHKAQSGSRVKKAIVVITDGQDIDSFYKIDELVAKVHRHWHSRSKKEFLEIQIRVGKS
jgi:Ca-activated chloride channel family protein